MEKSEKSMTPGEVAEPEVSEEQPGQAVADNRHRPQKDAPVLSRRHPDLFTEAEAAFYLCLEGVRSMEWVEANFALPHYTFVRRRVYYRADLDACALRMLGLDIEDQPLQRKGGKR